MKVCILVANDFTVDSRVIRQAQTFVRAGHQTLVVALGRGDVPAIEHRDGYEIRRVSTTWTWPDAYPRLGRVFGRLVRARGKGPRPPAPARDARPPGWLARRYPGLVRRVRGTLRAFPRKVRRRVQRVKRFGRRWIMLPTRYRQRERRMAEVAKEFHADLYWANDVTSVRAAAAAAKATGTRLAYDIHDVVWESPRMPRLQRLQWRLVERTNIRSADAVFTVCEPIARDTAARYRIPQPGVLLNCPRIEETSRARDPASSPLNDYRRPTERLILFHGGLAPSRGLEQLLSAVAHLPRYCRLVFMGYNKFRTVLEEQAQRLGVTDRVTFLAAVPPAELPAWLAGADVGTVPYQLVGRNHEYSTPNKLFEYMHAGVPVVVNDLPQVRRIVEEVGFGVVCDCSDPAAIAAAVTDILSDPERYEQMRKRARAAAEDRYNWETQEQTILAALE